MRPALLACVAALAAGCGSAAEPESRPGTTAGAATIAAASTASTASTATVAAERSPACAAGATRPVGSDRRSLAAIVRERAVAYRKPGGGPIETFGARNVNGVPTVFGVLARRVAADCRPTWYRVQLPLRPNGVTGWVRARDVVVEPVTTRIEVDLSERRVTLYDGGRRVQTARAAIGSAATPTPTGSYYVNQRLVPTDPTGPFGPGAIGISAFSDVLTGWAQGGPIAIHGTNRPDLIGRAVSNGCIRVANDELRRLFDRVLAGTPVVVTA
jgi:lipoprotein-anchoring transpeptidase ErfK/SrfK